ncbi:MAG: cobyrinate a,c-diamide synthase [Burkholderiales bacterium]|nr:cobyrinate a,c-diamide synthase [Burkholderiales bacterium]
MPVTNPSRLLISAAHKSSGKTTVAIGLAAALAARGLAVQPFKKGPDYIDPMWLARASGRPCFNLDPYLMSDAEIAASFERHAADADIAIVEGNKGLYDGLALDGSNSNAALARNLNLPVVLVIDARGMTRGIAPLILGYQAFDREVRIAGVILNRLGGHRHESKLRAVIEHYTDVAVLGAIHHDAALEIAERHLGLIPSNEHADAGARITRIRTAIENQVDLDKLLAVARTVPTSTYDAALAPSPLPRGEGTLVRLGVAGDAAFGFYYPGDLEGLQRAGAELIGVDTLRDRHLPALDGLFIGGGFPETWMEALEANQTLRADIRAAIETGLPVYAECGGLMYLARSLTWRGRRCAMVGALPGDVVMHDRPQGRGYVMLEETGSGPWPHGAAAPIPAHEFHYSRLENLELHAPLRFAYRVLRGTGIDGTHDGLVYKNLLACYSHLRDAGQHRWTARFVEFVRACKRSTQGQAAHSGMQRSTPATGGARS